MPKTRFLASVVGCLPVLGAGWGRDPVVGLKIPQNLKIPKKFETGVLTQFFCRLLKDPKRLGIGQVPGKHPLGPNEPRFMGPKT